MPRTVSRPKATHDIINTIDHWLAAGTSGDGQPNGIGEDVAHGRSGSRDDGFGDHMRTMLQHVPWHAYDEGMLRAILLLILDGMPDDSLERIRRLAESELEMVIGKMDAQEGVA